MARAPAASPSQREARSLDFHIKSLDGKMLVIHSFFSVCLGQGLPVWSSVLRPVELLEWRSSVSQRALCNLKCPYKEWQGGRWAWLSSDASLPASCPWSEAQGPRRMGLYPGPNGPGRIKGFSQPLSRERLPILGLAAGLTLAA